MGREAQPGGGTGGEARGGPNMAGPHCSEARQGQTAGPHFLLLHVLVLRKKAGVPQAGKGHVTRRQQGQRAKSDPRGG